MIQFSRSVDAELSHFFASRLAIIDTVVAPENESRFYESEA
ncbi:hypothetical protein [Burkholderia pseudomallei]|nr:hypothetical protein [Burkholderia pseudomallei]ABN82571.1 hypothetical protein BURPS668_0796 [Burkholderia pseudomallei 668]EDS86504.1 hypothetical protein BURPSS13_I0343 [Burkholderia pseudomallei S13]EDU09249.1 hypothetical protein BURPS1655_K0581 [Burkholderia pseudomallei 1655]EMP78897.1 hypothetical protein D512_04745 [Burkholderia pseudomallei MSHR1043]MDV2129226.1 hypothetical protein [Burkholderia pseudomallei]